MSLAPLPRRVLSRSTLILAEILSVATVPKSHSFSRRMLRITWMLMHSRNLCMQRFVVLLTYG